MLIQSKIINSSSVAVVCSTISVMYAWFRGVILQLLVVGRCCECSSWHGCRSVDLTEEDVE